MTTQTRANIDDAMTRHYDQLRQQLLALQSADVPDDKAISEVMAQLDATQLDLKAAHGQKGNNPRGHDPLPSPNEG